MYSNAKCLQLCFHEETNSSTVHLRWPEGEYIFSKCSFLGKLLLLLLLISNAVFQNIYTIIVLTSLAIFFQFELYICIQFSYNVCLLTTEQLIVNSR